MSGCPSVDSNKRAPARRPLAVLPTTALACALVLVCLASRVAHAGHESPFYPSFYPQEIRIETVDPANALAGWPKARVHAYVGDDLFADRAAPPDVAAVTSLRSFLVLTFDAGNDPAEAPRHHCAIAARIVHALPSDDAGYMFHPYPVTPFHADYLAQFDLAQRAHAHYMAPVTGTTDALAAVVRVRANGRLAEALLPARFSAAAGEPVATLEEIDVSRLAPISAGPGGWVAPPWFKQGWFHTYLLYAGLVRDVTARQSADAVYQRLVHGDYRDPTERVNLERKLVSMLIAGCERVVIGYTLRREYYNAEYSNGVENVAFDSQHGLLSPVFPRAVKLKDFPWNGWLRLGTASPPRAAWNPIGGFNDAFGRLLWSAVGDPALIPAPYGGSWIPARAHATAEPAPGAVAMPADALLPEAPSGRLRPVGAGRTARQRLRYTVLASAFHDGTSTGTADLLYPYIFAFRWGTDGMPRGLGSDPTVARFTALTREWLAGVKLVEVTTQTRDFGSDLQFRYQAHVIDVYLNHRTSDPLESAAIAPPWSTLPWEVMVLMEEAVQRGIAAFSEAEAQRRGIPWLDMVRDRQTGKRLAELVEQFRRQAYRPEALATLVRPDEARERWAALGRFYAQHGHFLVTNGPYRLDSWSADRVVLQVFRDLSYPLGVGAFDDYAIPLRAYAARIKESGDRLEIQAAVEQVSRFERSYEIVRTMLGPHSDHAEANEDPECQYVMIGTDGQVVRAGTAALQDSGRFILDFKNLPVPGRYTVMIALYLAGNHVNPEVKMIQHRVVGHR